MLGRATIRLGIGPHSSLCYFCVFGILCVLVFLGYCYFMLSVPVQLIAWKDHSQNELLYVERDVKQLLTYLLTYSLSEYLRTLQVIFYELVDWIIAFSALTLWIGHREEH